MNIFSSLLLFAYLFLPNSPTQSVSSTPPVKFGIWGVDKISPSKEKDLFCQLKKDNFDFIQSYSSFKTHSFKRLEGLLENIQECRINAILAIQPFRKNILVNPVFNSKLQLLSLYSRNVLVQIADEPRSKNQVRFLPKICRHIEKFSLDAHLQEGVNPTILQCVTQNGLHSHRKRPNINPSLKQIALNSHKLRRSRKDIVYTMRMFNSENQNNFVNVTYEDAKNELCYVLQNIKPNKIAFYTYNKRYKGAGMMQDPGLYKIATQLVLKYKNNKLICQK
ncbi:Hypothetical protein SynRCC307_0199 [Synechococcus sp. RCC307]|nr:Hypothetical protein SynRCC307_0199 [Synechococcus sp. RCC307]